MCSTDIDELAALCDRVVVFHQGRMSAELAGEALQTHVVLEAMNTGALGAAPQPSNVGSGATATSSTSGVSRPASVPSSVSSRSSSSA